jgi:hypothetical protein
MLTKTITEAFEIMFAKTKTAVTTWGLAQTVYFNLMYSLCSYEATFCIRSLQFHTHSVSPLVIKQCTVKTVFGEWTHSLHYESNIAR